MLAGSPSSVGTCPRRFPMSASDPRNPPASFLSLPDPLARQRLLQALAALEPMQRQVVGRRLCGQSDLERIAAALDCPPDNVRVLLVQGIGQLRLALSDDPADRTRNDWLKRCQSLLQAGARPSGTAALRDARGASPAATSRPALPAGTWVLATLLLGLALGLGGWLWRSQPAPPLPPVDPELAARPEPVPESAPGGAVPAADADQVPLTAPDLELVLLQQRHPGLLENLDFYLWLVEKDALR